MGTGGQDAREMETGDLTRHRALLGLGMMEDSNKERIPPECQRTLNACSHQGGRGGGGRPLTQQRVPTARSQGLEGDS